MIEYFKYIQIIVILITVIIGLIVLQARSTKAQTMYLMVMVFTLVYMVGYFIEYTTQDLNVMIAAIKIEYVGYLGFYLGYVGFISEFCEIKFPKGFYILQGLFTLVILYGVFTIGSNHFMYSDIGRETFNGHIQITKTGEVGFYLASVYFIVMTLIGEGLCFYRLKDSHGVKKRRYLYVIIGSVVPWIAIVMGLIPNLRGIDFYSFGILFMLIWFSIALIRYGYFNSFVLAGENALAKAIEGIAVTDSDYQIVYLNEKMQSSFPELREDDKITKNSTFAAVINGKQKACVSHTKIYDVRIEPLKELNHIQGYMIWAIDMTEHYTNLDKMRIRAETDFLTGIHNRSFFIERLENFITLKTYGTMLMIDIDDFKYVNDHYGHKVGDEVLIAFSQALKDINITNKILCRFGGDEFCGFFPGVLETEVIEHICKSINRGFVVRLKNEGLPQELTISMGASIFEQKTEKDLNMLYRDADEALYKSKESGKNKYYVKR